MRSSPNILVVLGALFVAASAGSATEPDWAAVDQAIGRKGADLPGGVRKYSFPRSDLHITVDGTLIKPALALGGWVAFQRSTTGAMYMGDLVLTDAEISPVMKQLIDGGVEITAIHNHLLRTSSPVFFMHIGGHGDPIKFGSTLRAALALSQTPAAAPTSTAPAPLDLDTESLEEALGVRGHANGGVYQFSVARVETITEHGSAVAPAMGTAIAINFQPTGASRAAMAGDFVLLGNEVNPVLKTLRDRGIEVTALHSHMIEDSPHLFFMHFWANDDARTLARGMRAALEQVHVKRER